MEGGVDKLRDVFVGASVATNAHKNMAWHRFLHQDQCSSSDGRPGGALRRDPKYLTSD